MLGKEGVHGPHLKLVCKTKSAHSKSEPGPRKEQHAGGPCATAPAGAAPRPSRKPLGCVESGPSEAATLTW